MSTSIMKAAAVVTAALVAFVPPSYAETEPKDNVGDKIKEAREHADAAEQHQKDGHHGKAIKEYSRVIEKMGEAAEKKK